MTTATRPTKKAFRELLNEWYADLKWRNNEYHNRVRPYGDYLYAQDLDMFNCCYSTWIKSGCTTDQRTFESLR